MSSVNYNLGNKGVRLISAEEAFVFNAKTGRRNKLSPKYKFVGKIEMTMPNMILSASDKQKPTYKGDVSGLNRTAKKQIVEHFYGDNGKRNKRTVAYFGIEKTEDKTNKRRLTRGGIRK